jgi:hypothetical protein
MDTDFEPDRREKSMNRKARRAATRSLGLSGIAMLFAGFVAAFGQSTPPKQPYSTWSDFGGSVDTQPDLFTRGGVQRNNGRAITDHVHKAKGPNPLGCDQIYSSLLQNSEGPR